MTAKAQGTPRTDAVWKQYGIDRLTEKPYVLSCELETALATAQAELARWERPFDQERFDAVKQQASHKDSLAAQHVYICALEHALKHREAELEKCRAVLMALDVHRADYEDIIERDRDAMESK